MFKHVCFIGAGGAGKDVAGEALVEKGFKRISVGDRIKQRYKDRYSSISVEKVVKTIMEHNRETPVQARMIAKDFAIAHSLMFKDIDPFTENRVEKSKLRAALEWTGMAYYNEFITDLFSTVDASPEVRWVSTRGMQLEELRGWASRGGVIVEVIRPGVSFETDFSKNAVTAAREDGLVSLVLLNAGSRQHLKDMTVSTLLPIMGDKS